MLIIDGVTVSEVSKQLGVKPGLLYQWKQKHLDELEANQEGEAPSPKAMADEIAELRKRLAKAERMNEILKKTVGYFSKDD